MASDGITLTVEPGYGTEFVLNRLESWTDLIVKVRTSTGLSSYLHLLEIDNDNEPAISVVRVDSDGAHYGNPFLIEIDDISEIVV